MELGADGLPDPSKIVPVAVGARNPVDLQQAPDGDIYYVDHEEGQIHRLRYLGPHAVASADKTYGPTPLTVAFSSAGSTPGNPGATLSYSWDFGDGTTSTAANPTHTYTTPGHDTARLTITEAGGSSSDSADVEEYPGDTPPTASIDSPNPPPAWSVGDPIAFSGSATDHEDATLPASAFKWSVILHHCVTPSACHTHEIEDLTGPSGSVTAPDHAYPSYLELRLTVTDSGGLSDTKSLRLDPRTVNLTLDSSPPGLQLGFNLETAQAPFTRTVIAGSANTVSAPSPQAAGSATQVFDSWSDGGAQTHNLTAAAGATLTASYDSLFPTAPVLPPPAVPAGPPGALPAGPAAGKLTIGSLRLSPTSFRVPRARGEGGRRQPPRSPSCNRGPAG